VTDRMWISLEQVPLWVHAVDALGRHTPVVVPHFRDHTLELAACDLPAGAIVLRIGMPDGVRLVRFVKL